MLRFWIGTLACFAFVLFAISILLSEISFGLNSVSSTGEVESYTPKKLVAKLGMTLVGRGGGTMTHLVGGPPVKATFQSWYFRRGPGKGERLPVIYLPTEPGFIKVDSVMQRYGPVSFPFILAFALAYWSGILRFSRRRVKEIDDQRDLSKPPGGRDLEA